MTRATGKDDPALAETTWPMPDMPGDDDSEVSLEWKLRHVEPSRADLTAAAGILAAYHALITDGTTTQQIKRLAALRRVHRRRTR